MRKLLVSILILFIQNVFSQDFQWVKQIKGKTDYNEFAKFIEVDNLGNSYVLGVTESRLFDIDPSPNGEQIINNTNTPANPLRETYLIKLDENGNFIWGKTFGIRKSGDEVYGLKIGPDGNINILAMISELDISANVILNNVSVIKINTFGNELSRIKLRNFDSWSNGTLYINSFDIDNQNNYYLSGRFLNNVKLNLTNPNLDLNAVGIGSYLLKTDNIGNIIWKEVFDYQSSQNERIICRSDGNLNLLFGSSDSNNQLTQRLFKINSSDGNVIWEKDFLNQNPELFYISNNNNLIISSVWAASVGEQIDVDPSSNSVFVNSTGNYGRYFLWLDSEGNFVNVKPYSGNQIFPKSITSDINNNYYIVGTFARTVDFDPSNNNFYLTSQASQLTEGFFLKFDSNLNFENAFRLGKETPLSNMYHNCYEFVFNDLKVNNNNFYFTGEFQWWADFDPSPTNNFSLGTVNSGTVNKDGFILKLTPCDTRSPNGDSDQYFCSSQNPTINSLSPNSSSIKWYNSLTSTSQLTTTDALINGHTYYATRKLGSCPESIDRLVVTVHINQTPQPPTASNQAFCENYNASISNLVVIGQNLNWYDSAIGGNLLASSTMLQNSTTYYVSQTVNNCESNRTPISITIKPSTKPTLSSPQDICIQQNATLSNIVITGQNIKWYDAQTGGNLLPTNTILQNGTTYYASQTNTNCESNRVPVSITIYNTPSPTANSNQSFCSTANATLSDIAISGTGVKWYDAQTGGNLLPANTIIQNATTYYATQTINGCESVNRLPIIVTLINTLNATDFSDYLCDDLNNGYEKIDLTSYNSSLISNTTGNTFSFYKSFLGAQNQTPSEKINNENDFPLNVGTSTIYVRIDNVNTCHQIVELNLTLYSKPIIPIAEVTPICQGKTVTINAGNFDQYQWSTGETSSSILVSQAGNYSVSVTENHIGINCNSTKDFKVVNSNVATISQVITNDWTVNENSITIVVTTSSVGDYQYSLDGNNYQNSNVFTDLYSGEYNIFIRDKNGCGTISEEVFLLMYPKYFTPNGDGFNDKWKIKFSNTEPSLRIKLFDRFGKFIKELDYSSDGWNGTFNGKELPSTDYWFVVTRANGKEYRGHFAMKR